MNYTTISVQESLNRILTERKASIEEMLEIFDELEPATLELMTGRWNGFEIETGHFLDGLLGPSGWYGKLFASPEEVHPLLFYTKNKTGLYSVNPSLVPLRPNLPKFEGVGFIMRLIKPFVKTKKAHARMRMIEFRGKVTGTMVYDKLAIMDHFAKIDDNTLLGVMDLKGRDYYPFVLERDNTDYKLEF